MIYKVLSRKQAKDISFNTEIPLSVMISINDISEVPFTADMFKRNPKIKDALILIFDDVDKCSPNCITHGDGKKIVDFITKYKDKVDQIIVHCGAGISRSSGVCAAIMEILGDNSWGIFGNPKFCPNMTCYRTVLNAAMFDMDEEDISNKEFTNLDLWRKENDLV